MQIESLFEKDINRYINGVVDVLQDEDAAVRQELSEYVVTRELQRHFATFFESYDSGLSKPTSQIGVWISGFFGSGKSHFLKMLSTLLVNREVGGKPAASYFEGKIENPFTFAQLQRAAEVPTESILFNIGAKATQWKDGDKARTAVLRAFASMFYAHLGFCREKLGVARFEMIVEEEGKTEEFRKAYEDATGKDWVGERHKYTLRKNAIIESLQSALGVSEEAARDFYEEGRSDTPPSIDDLVDQIASYVARRKAEEGGRFRLLFMVDELGQFMGSDVGLMLELQTIVERVGSVCGGDVWVMVTSQEAIDDILPIVENDFSKIQGRFRTRLSLSSSSVDEVIKSRILQKKEATAAFLEDQYADQSSTLKNLFSFTGNARGDLFGYESATDFVESYPFVGYQFKLLPDVMEQVRRHGLGAKHMSTGERSMLSAFQESARVVGQQETGTLVPFWRFYDTIEKDLDHGIVQVFSRAFEAAEKDKGLVPADVPVLKALYLVRYIDYLPSNLDNVCILMADKIEVDKVALREAVKGSLDRLIGQNYVARSGDVYSFLTDEEQDVARDIAATDIEVSAVVERMKDLVFGDILSAQKHRKGANDFPFDRYLDDTAYGSLQNGMKLNILSVASEGVRWDDATLALKSSGQALVVLPDDAETYYRSLVQATKIRKYVKTKNVKALPPATQLIIKHRQDEASRNEKDASRQLAEAIKSARVAVDGRMVSLRGATTARAVLEGALDELVNSVFTKADCITAPVAGQSDVIQLLAGTAQGALSGTGGANERALDEVETYLGSQSRLGAVPAMGDVQRKFQGRPFGWREYDVAGVVARLLAEGRAQVLDRGRTLNVQDANDRKRIAECLTGKAADSLEIRKRQLPSVALMGKARALLRDLPDAPSVPDDIDGLTRVVIEVMEAQHDWCCDRLNDEYEQREYPERGLVERGMLLAGEVLKSRADEVALLKAFTDADDDLLDWSEDSEAIRGFFPNQARLFNDAFKLQEAMAAEGIYLVDSTEARQALAEMGAILRDPKPYGRISELPALGDTVRRAHDEVVRVGRSALLDRMDAALEEIRDYAEDIELPAGLMGRIEQELAAKKGQVHGAATRASLDAATTQLENWSKAQLAAIDHAVEEERLKQEREEAMRKRQEEGVTVLKPNPAASQGHPASSGPAGATPPAEAPEPRKPRTRTIERRDLCRAQRLTSEADIDDYVNAIRKKLEAALADSDTVSIR